MMVFFFVFVVVFFLFFLFVFFVFFCFFCFFLRETQESLTNLDLRQFVSSYCGYPQILVHFFGNLARRLLKYDFDV